MTHRPRFPFPYEAYEIPLHYRPSDQLELQWTLVLCFDMGGDFLEGVVYNGNAQRGAYYRMKVTSWELTEFEGIGNEKKIPNEIMRKASSYISHLLGTSAHVHHSTHLE